MNRVWAILAVLWLAGGAAATAGPLHDAAAAGDIDAVKRLIEAGADVNEQDRFGFTPLDIAALRGYGDIVTLLSRQTTGWQRAVDSGAKPLPPQETDVTDSADAEATTDQAAPDDGAPTTATETGAANQAAAQTGPAAVSDGSDGYRVQLGAVRSEALIAEHEAARLSRRYEDALSGTSLRVEHGVLADGGDVWRIRTDPLSQADARALCDALKAAGHDCFVVKGP